MAEAGCRKLCLQGAFNTSEENRISPPLSLRSTKTSRSRSAGLAEEGEDAGIKADQLSCVYGVPIISDGGRKDSVSRGCSTKAQERPSSCVRGHAAEAGAAISTHQNTRKRSRTRSGDLGKGLRPPQGSQQISADARG